MTKVLIIKHLGRDWPCLGFAQFVTIHSEIIAKCPKSHSIAAPLKPSRPGNITTRHSRDYCSLLRLLLAEEREKEFRLQMAAVKELAETPLVPIGKGMTFEEWRAAEQAEREKRMRDGEGSRRRWADMREKCEQRGPGKWIVRGREGLGEFKTIDDAYRAASS